MSWDAVGRTIEARLEALTSRLPALIAAAGLPPIASDAMGHEGLAVYDSPRLSYASPCVEVMPIEAAIQKASTMSTLSECEGFVTLSYTTTDPTEIKRLSVGYLTCLMHAFSEPRENPDEYWEVTLATMSPSSKQGDDFAQAVAIKVLHQLAEHV